MSDKMSSFLYIGDIVSLYAEGSVNGFISTLGFRWESFRDTPLENHNSNKKEIQRYTWKKLKENRTS